MFEAAVRPQESRKRVPPPASAGGERQSPEADDSATPAGQAASQSASDSPAQPTPVAPATDGFTPARQGNKGTSALPNYLQGSGFSGRPGRPKGGPATAVDAVSGAGAMAPAAQPGAGQTAPTPVNPGAAEAFQPQREGAGKDAKPFDLQQTGVQAPDKSGKGGKGSKGAAGPGAGAGAAAANAGGAAQAGVPGSAAGSSAAPTANAGKTGAAAGRATGAGAGSAAAAGTQLAGAGGSAGVTPAAGAGGGEGAGSTPAAGNSAEAGAQAAGAGSAGGAAGSGQAAAGAAGGGAAAGATGGDSAPAQEAEGQAEEKMDAAEPEAEAGEASGEGGATAESQAGGDAGGAAASQQAEAAEAGESDGAEAAEAGGAQASAGGAGGEAAPQAQEAAPGAASGGMQPQAEAGAGVAGGGAGADPDAQQRAQEQAEQTQQQADNERVSQQGTEERDEDQAEQDAESGNTPALAEAELSGPEKAAATESVGEEQPAEGGGGGGGGGAGGGGAEAKADEAPPDVSSMPPEQGLATLSSATPAQADAALGGVQRAAAAENEEQTQAAQAPLPQTTVGEPPSPRVSASKGGGAGGAAGAQGAAPATGAASPKTKPAPTPAPPVGNAADKVARPNVAKPAQGAEPSAADKAQVAASISALPTSDPGLKTRMGAAPTLQLSGAADPAQMAAQKARSDQAVAVARASDAAEVARPMGEQNVRPTVGETQIKARTLKARAAGAAGGAAGSAGAGGAAGGARGVLAEELSGPEVRAAMAAASAQAAAAKIATQAKIAAGSAAAQAEIGGIKSQAATEQDAVRTRVRGDAQNARSQYSRKQQAAITQLDHKQQQTIAKTGEKATEEKLKGEEEAAAQIEEGEQQTTDKAEVETEVAQKKQEAQAQTEEKGFFGRLADDLGAWFDRQKKWISDKVEAGKKWIKETADRFKKYAAEKIDEARDRVTGLIKEGGELLKSGADALLADFPAARDAVKGAIDSGVEIGVQATNDIAEGAKNRVNRAVDAVATVAEGALDLGGKAANAAIDYAKSTTVDALNKADKAMAALGVLKVLVEDVASDPGGWVGKLGSSAKDGVANHLAAAMKAAIKQWWEGKLESVLGVGPAIWEVLKKGGLGLKEIGAMAWSAIKAAIPPALVQLIIEKVVAMIIPAAGAVIAIIEGLQAAWGSVSAMLGAVGKAIAFLKAVKGGGAGPQFAQLVAAAAVVVIDFVSNWLLAKLGKAIIKIGGKIKGIAQKLLKKISAAVKKFSAKRKTKKKAKAKRKNKSARDRKAKQLREQRKNRKADKDGKKKDDPNRKQKDKKDDKAARLRKAVDAIRPKLLQMAAKGKVSGLLVRAKLLFWRARHRLSKLALEGSGNSAQVIAQVNPSENVLAFVRKHGSALRKIIYDVAKEIFARSDVQKAVARHKSVLDGESTSTGTPLQVRSPAEALALSQVLSEKRKRSATHVEFAGGGRAAVDRKPSQYHPSQTELGPGLQHVREGGKYQDHPEIFQAAANQDQRPVSAMQSLANVTMLGGAGPHRTPAARDFAAQQALLKIVEMSRSGQAAVVTMEQAQMVGQGMIPHAEGIAGDPMTPKGAVQTSNDLERRTGAHKGDGDVKTRSQKVKQMIEQQIQFIATVMEARYGAANMMFKDEHGLMESVRSDVHKAVKQITEQNLGLSDPAE